MVKKRDKKRSTNQDIIKELGYFLADSYVLYVKTQNFHWNLVGEQFYMYHKLLEEQYKELAEAIDEIAERIRMLDAVPPSSMKEFLEITHLKEANPYQKDSEMIFELQKDHEELSLNAKELIDLCDESDDQGTLDLIVERLRFHDKSAWMLKSHLMSKKK